MDNMEQMDLVALKGYICELEDFKARVSKYCTELEKGIGSCSGYMLDGVSQRALQKGRKAAADIKACLFPIDRLLYKANGRLRELEPDYDLDY